MKRVTSKLLVFPVGRGAELGFRGVGIHVFGQFCIRDRKVLGGRMVRPGGKFPMKPEGTNLRCILIAHAMRYKSRVRNGHKILRGLATRPAKSEGVFADCSLRFKSNVLYDNRIAHKRSAIPEREIVACVSLGASPINREIQKNDKRGTFMMAHLCVSM